MFKLPCKINNNPANIQILSKKNTGNYDISLHNFGSPFLSMPMDILRHRDTIICLIFKAFCPLLSKYTSFYIMKLSKYTSFLSRSLRRPNYIFIEQVNHNTYDV